MSQLISINEAAEKGIERLRFPKWALKHDHIKLTLHNGSLIPWIKLYSPQNKSLHREDPATLLFTHFNLDAKEWEPYTGDLPGSETYLEAEEAFHELGDLIGDLLK